MRTPAYEREERPRHASSMTWIGNAAAEKMEKMVLEDTGPPVPTLVGVSYLARPISAYPITHSNYGTQAIIHGVPIIPRHGRPLFSKYLFPFSSKSVFLFINSSSSFFSGECCYFERNNLSRAGERGGGEPFRCVWRIYIYMYVGEGDRVNERLRVMKMSVRGDVERAAWKG